MRDKVFSKLILIIIEKHTLTEISLSAVASKCGFDVFGDGSVTNSASHIKTYIEGTIDRLGFTPDLYYLHRIDPSVFARRLLSCHSANQAVSDTPLEESISALDEIRKAGKTKYIGLSECSAKTLRKANTSKHGPTLHELDLTH